MWLYGFYKMKTLSKTLLQTMFPRRLIFHFKVVSWSPCPPKLFTCDFFLWKHLKSRVCACKPRSLNNITQEINLVDRNTLGIISSNFNSHLENYIKGQSALVGYNFSHITNFCGMSSGLFVSFDFFVELSTLFQSVSDSQESPFSTK